MKAILLPLFLLASIFTLASAEPETKKVEKAKDGATKTENEATHLDAKASAKLLANDKKEEKPAIIILDLRTPGEYKEGHLDGAKNINFLADDFEDNLGKLDKSKPYLVHCRSGGRSGTSLTTFKKLGFTKVYHLDGGTIAWEKAGQKLVK